MRIITHTCPSCGTIIAANELEANREMLCPGLGCDTVLRFQDLSTAEQQFFMENKEQYQI